MPSAQQAAAMMENMDPSALEGMIDMVKSNPGVLKDMMKSNPMFANMNPETLDAQLDMLDKMDPDQLKKYLGYAAKAQKAFAPVLKVYGRVDTALAGKLKHILIGAFLALTATLCAKLFAYLFGVDLFFFTKRTPSDVSDEEEPVVANVIDAALRSAVGGDDDEFDN